MYRRHHSGLGELLGSLDDDVKRGEIQRLLNCVEKLPKVQQLREKFPKTSSGFL